VPLIKPTQPVPKIEIFITPDSGLEVVAISVNKSLDAILDDGGGFVVKSLNKIVPMA